MLDVMRMRFKEDGMFRMMVYAAALVLDDCELPPGKRVGCGRLGTSRIRVQDTFAPCHRSFGGY